MTPIARERFLGHNQPPGLARLRVRPARHLLPRLPPRPPLAPRGRRLPAHHDGGQRLPRRQGRPAREPGARSGAIIGRFANRFYIINVRKPRVRRLIACGWRRSMSAGVDSRFRGNDVWTSPAWTQDRFPGAIVRSAKCRNEALNTESVWTVALSGRGRTPGPSPPSFPRKRESTDSERRRPAR